jgi:Tfp pilus assembly protein PilN
MAHRKLRALVVPVLVAALLTGAPLRARAEEKSSNPEAEQLRAQLMEIQKQMDTIQKALESKQIPPERRSMMMHDMDSMRNDWQHMHDHCRW